MKSVFGPITWGILIIIGGVILTPVGLTPIVTNPVLRIGTGVTFLMIGVIGFISLVRQSTPG